MKLEKQVCNLTQAQRLKELGVNCESIFYWFRQDKNYWLPKDDPAYFEDIYYTLEPGSAFYNGWELTDSALYPAYTVAELGVLLRKNRYSVDYGIRENGNAGFLREWYSSGTTKYISKIVETEAEARAEVLIWLLEKGFLKAEDLKL